MTPFSFGTDPNKRWWHVSSFSITSSSIIQFSNPSTIYVKFLICPNNSRHFAALVRGRAALRGRFLSCTASVTTGTSGNSMFCLVPLGTWSTSSLPILLLSSKLIGPALDKLSSSTAVHKFVSVRADCLEDSCYRCSQYLSCQVDTHV